jgi:predicted amidophosphoribosyltransferase
MLCLACRLPAPAALCDRCGGWLRPAPERTAGNLRVRSAFVHEGPARQLVHALKYRGLSTAADLLAGAMAPLVPAEVVLVPAPRARWRLLRYGVDPAWELTRRLARLTGNRCLRLLRPPIYTPPQAGQSRNGRHPPIFLVARSAMERMGLEDRLVLIDDVLTTGGTLLAASAALAPKVTMGVTATVSAV